MSNLRDFNVVLGADLVAKGLNAVAVLATMRFMTPTDFGEYVFVTAAALTACSFFNGFFNRRIVFNRIAHDDLPSAQWVAVGLAALAFFAIAAFARFASVGSALAGLTLTCAAVAFDFRRSCLQRAGRFGLYSAREVQRGSLFLVATLAILWFVPTDRAVWILGALAGSYVLGALALSKAAFAGARHSYAGIVTGARALWTLDSLQLSTFFILFGLLANLPALLYRPLASVADYAEFGVAFRYYGLLVAITSAFHIVTMPAIANVSAEHAGGLARRILLMGLFALALVLGAVVAGYLIIPLVDGGKYPQAPMLFALLSSGLVFGIFCGIIISSCLRTGQYASLIAGGGVSVAVTAWILWRFAAEHAIAAALAMPAGLACQLLILVVWHRKNGVGGLLAESQTS